MANLLKVEQRKQFGKRHNRRMRYDGKLPAVLYGHGEEVVSLSLSSDELENTVRHGAKVVELSGAASGKALLQDVQWDTFFHHVLHVDLLRVRAGEKVTVEVPIELRGESPGANEGGVVEQLIHSVEIEVPLDLVPEKLHISVKNLQVGGSLLIKDIIDLPAGATIAVDPDEVVVHCELPVAEEEAAAEEAVGAAEPEVISKGKEEEEEGEAEEKG
ncbi:MAG TPA: 50S ribosomal protein L25 [Lacipirellulaceae bacterium]|jgi:large subunit ribosomal protein L25